MFDSMMAATPTYDMAECLRQLCQPAVRDVTLHDDLGFELAMAQPLVRRSCGAEFAAQDGMRTFHRADQAFQQAHPPSLPALQEVAGAGSRAHTRVALGPPGPALSPVVPGC